MDVEQAFIEAPLSRIGRNLLYANLAFIGVLVVLPWIYYAWLPQEIPSHWDFHGNITSYIDKLSMVVLLTGIMPLANIIIVAVVAYRWVILNKYPYLINISAIAVVLSLRELEPTERSRLINRIFEVILAAGFLIGLYMLGIEFLMLESMAGHFCRNVVFAFTFLGSIALVAVVILMYKKVYEEEVSSLLKH